MQESRFFPCYPKLTQKFLSEIFDNYPQAGTGATERIKPATQSALGLAAELSYETHGGSRVCWKVHSEAALLKSSAGNKFWLAVVKYREAFIVGTTWNGENVNAKHYRLIFIIIGV